MGNQSAKNYKIMSKTEDKKSEVQICEMHDSINCVYCEEKTEEEIDYSKLCCGGDCNNGCDRYDIDRDNELAFS